MKKINPLLIILCFILMPGCQHREVKYASAPTMLPGNYRDMKTAGFWISKVKNPDQILLSAQQVKEFNNLILKKGLPVKKIEKIKSTYSGKKLSRQLKSSYQYVAKKRLYPQDSQLLKAAYLTKMQENINLKQIASQIKVRFGLIVRYTDQRALPGTDKFFRRPGEEFIDMLQTSALDIATPVAVLHQSRDENWFFVLSPLSNGWVKASDIALCDPGQLKKYINDQPFAIVTAAKGELFLDQELKNYYDYMRMGVRLPLIKKNEQSVTTVLIPGRDQNGNLVEKKGFIQSQQINPGYLSYTTRNIMQQAFKLLNTPYGWGGMFGEQDCSRFIYQVFSTVGLVLPRNSTWQAQTGNQRHTFDDQSTNEEKKAKIIEFARPGVSIFQLPGHIMLYLGMHDNTPYVIHSIWAYQENIAHKDSLRLINKVAVTHLRLSEGTKRGSLLERLKTIANIVQ